MRPFYDWLDRVLTAGESVQNAPPQLAREERPAVEARLHIAFDLHALDVAGPRIAFEPTTAIRAAEVLARSCWLLVNGDESEPAPALDAEASPSAHLAADVTLRFLPAVFRRARLRSPGGPLALALDRLLRAWPLTGVLADLDGVPTAAPEFDHPGLQLLYAERLAATARAGWVPAAGPGREWAERAFVHRGLTLPISLPTEDRRD